MNFAPSCIVSVFRWFESVGFSCVSLPIPLPDCNRDLCVLIVYSFWAKTERAKFYCVYLRSPLCWEGIYRLRVFCLWLWPTPHTHTQRQWALPLGPARPSHRRRRQSEHIHKTAAGIAITVSRCRTTLWFSHSTPHISHCGSSSYSYITRNWSFLHFFFKYSSKFLSFQLHF